MKRRFITIVETIRPTENNHENDLSWTKKKCGNFFYIERHNESPEFTTLSISSSSSSLYKNIQCYIGYLMSFFSLFCFFLPGFRFQVNVVLYRIIKWTKKNPIENKIPEKLCFGQPRFLSICQMTYTQTEKNLWIFQEKNNVNYNTIEILT